MIRLRSISPELKKEYRKYRFVKLKNYLKDLETEGRKSLPANSKPEEELYHRECRKIVEYLSRDGCLDETKIENLLLGDISQLKAAVDAIGQINSKDIKEGFEHLYDNFTKQNLGKKWASMTGVTVCPYCNRSYIFMVDDGGVRPQYDHFFPKSKYPYLSISMYNLIPCCSVCNLAKHDGDSYKDGKLTMLYPYESGYGEQAVFNVSNKANQADWISAWLGTAAEYRVELKYADGIASDLRMQIENSWKAFKLEELYEQHSDYIRDILRTKYIYNDEYFESLVAEFPSLFSNADEAKNLVFLNYLDEQDWGKRILAKLTHDLETPINFPEKIEISE